MGRTKTGHPTELELQILKVLWEESPLPVREVRERLRVANGRVLAHSSVITMLNIMYDKGFLRRRKVGKAFEFSPKVARNRVTGRMMRDWIAKVYDGSASAMVLNLIETADLDSEELSEIRELIRRKTKEQQQ